MLTTRQKIAIARTLQQGVSLIRRASGLKLRTRTRRRGLTWDLDLDEGIDFSIWLAGAFEPATVSACAKLVRPGDTVFDAGANIGAHTLHLARAVGRTGRVHAFEPTDWAREKLSTNLALNPDLAERVTVVPAMLVDVPGTSPPSLYSSWPLAGKPGTHPLHGGRKMSTANAVTTTLDDYVARVGVTRVNFIKLDVDGFEGSVLRGAQVTLMRFRPTIILELAPHALADEGDSIEALAALIANLRYTLATLSGRALPPDGDTIRALIKPGASINVVAQPTERGGRLSS